MWALVGLSPKRLTHFYCRWFTWNTKVFATILRCGWLSIHKKTICQPSRIHNMQKAKTLTTTPHPCRAIQKMFHQNFWQISQLMPEIIPHLAVTNKQNQPQKTKNATLQLQSLVPGTYWQRVVPNDWTTVPTEGLDWHTEVSCRKCEKCEGLARGERRWWCLCRLP